MRDGRSAEQLWGDGVEREGEGERGGFCEEYMALGVGSSCVGRGSLPGVPREMHTVPVHGTDTSMAGTSCKQQTEHRWRLSHGR